MSARRARLAEGCHVLSVEDLALRWQVNAKTIYSAISDGRIPVLPFKRPFRIAMKVVEVWKRKAASICRRGSDGSST